MNSYHVENIESFDDSNEMYLTLLEDSTLKGDAFVFAIRLANNLHLSTKEFSDTFGYSRPRFKRLMIQLIIRGVIKLKGLPHEQD